MMSLRGQAGCFTCRVRKKKCDIEDPDHDALKPCEECCRLEIECTGFGKNLPDWMRGKHKQEVRNKIKEYEIVIGRLRGHVSRSLVVPRGSVQRPLRLSPSGTITPTFPGPSSYQPYTDPVPSTSYGHHGLTLTTTSPLLNSHRSTSASSSCSSENESSGSLHEACTRSPSQDFTSPHHHHHTLAYDSISEAYAYYGARLDTYPATVPDVCKIEEPSPNVEPVMLSSPTCVFPYLPPPAQSGTSSSSSTSTDNVVHAITTSNSSTQLVVVSEPQPPPIVYIKDAMDMLNQLYISTVSSRAFMMADPTLIHSVHSLNKDSHIAQSAMFTLCATFLEQTGRRWNLVNSDIIVESTSVVQGLVKKFQSQSSPALGDGRITKGEAMGGLHLITNSLFAPRFQHPWQIHLLGALRYAYSVLPQYRAGTLSHEEQFIVCGTAWATVLACVSYDIPRQFRRMFLDFLAPASAAAPASSLVVQARGAGMYHHPQQPLPNMYELMGAENHVLWAIAQTTEIVYTHDADETQRMIAAVEACLQTPTMPCTAADSQAERDRRSTAETFRLSALLYLRAVQYDSVPSHEGIRLAIEDVVHRLMDLSLAPVTTRMTVLGVYLSGALTCDVSHIAFIKRRLREAGSGGLGNTVSVLQALEDVWRSREAKGWHDSPVDWRQPLLDYDVLLV